MSTYTAAVVCDNSSLANFQSWTSLLYTAFVTQLGWVQTSDTGQAANPIAAVPSSTYVYWIFKANDSQASTTPIFVKVELGWSSTSPSIRITVGSGSSGAGVITGSVMGPYIITAGSSGGVGTDNALANQGGGTYNCYFSGDAGSFRMLMWQNNAAVETILGIERSRDTSGNKTTDYVTMLSFCAETASNQATGFVQQTMMDGSVTSREYNAVSFVSSSGYASGAVQTEAFAGSVAVNQIFPLVGFSGNPMLGFCQAAASDVAESNGTVVTVSIYGANHSYLATKNGAIAAGFAPFSTTASGTFANRAILMLYE